MSEGPQLDIGAQNFARGLGGGAGAGPSDSKDPANEESQFDYTFTAIADKIAGFLEHFGIDFGQLGKVSVSKAVGGDTEGLHEKKIMPGGGGILPNAPGGFLARLATAIGLKNLLDIKDHTQGASSGANIEAASGGEGFAGGGDFSGMIGGGQGSMGDFAFVDYGTGNFGATGQLAPIDMPIISSGRSSGAELS
jgi:hypothetical protein